MANMNTCSKSVVTRKIQIKTIMKYNQILIRMTKIKITDHTKYWQRCEVSVHLRRQCSSTLKIPGPVTFLVVQWLRFHTSIATGMGSIPGGGTKNLHAVLHSKNKK